MSSGVLETDSRSARASATRADVRNRAAWLATREARALRPHPARLVRIGILGLGNVGQAVARLLWTQRPRLLSRGLDLRIVAALVRDSKRTRGGVEQHCITSDAARFLERRFDVAIEALGGIEPARACVSVLLERGIPVVTPNKSLLAACGPSLRSLARASGATLRCEAAALAGIPFLGLLERRPLAADVERLVGIVNGTSNFVLTRVRETGATIQAALAEAQRLGLAEPNPANDVLGVDAAEKLVVLLQTLGVEGVRTASIETRGILGLAPEDLVAALRLGGVIKPIAAARIDADVVEAHVGPVLLPADHALARIEQQQNGICLSGRLIGELLYSGPGAGPDVTAATIVDDVVEAMRESAAGKNAPSLVHPEAIDASTAAPTVRAPLTPWLVRLTTNSPVLDTRRICEFLASGGVWTRQSIEGRCDGKRAAWLVTHAVSRESLERALASLRAAAGIDSFALRSWEE